MDFYPLLVRSLDKTTKDCTLVTFTIDPEYQKRFEYKQGQYLTLKTNIDGEEVRRSYSLCSSPIDGNWSIGVKEVPQGKFSSFVNQQLQEGDTLDVAPPQGKFFTEVEKNKKKNYVAFAAGSGITPVISIIKTHLALEPKATFQLFCINQSTASIILKEELEALKNTYLERFEIFHFLTREERNIPLLNGRLDTSKLETLFQTVCDKDQIDHVFVCGPEEMIFTVRDFLIAKGLKREAIHFELFNTQGAGKPSIVAAEFQGKVADVSIREGGKKLNFKMVQGAQNLLDAALDNSADLPFACKGGVCCTCKAKLIEGKVDMLVNYGLEEDEVADGYILTCQAVPVSEKIVVDFDS